ncbi:MAG: putative toxin-antitoxin system toxin component, PIN family [Candidatus Rokubacteria bacterium]|nr:putative toxin-antitoxin system toxin component, PIN family [Candidatus Rokubacteria bacterium]
MRAVLDTNVVVSAILIPRGKERRILDAWRRGAFDIVTAPALLEELARVLSYPKIRERRWMSDAELRELLEGLSEGSIVVSGDLDVRAGRDANDNMFLGAAVEGDADYLVTGDHDLLVLRSYRRVEIVRPAAILRAF